MATSPPRNPVAPSSNAHKPSSVVVVKRRNALVPLPLLPPVPKNTIVTSVKIVHNQEPDSPPESPTSDEEEDGARDPAPPKEEENEEIKSPPISPTQANFNFPSMASNKRNRSQRRRSCCTPRSPPPCGSRGNSGAPPPQADVCQSQSQSQSPPGTPGEVGTSKPPDTNNNPPPSNSLSSSTSSSKRKKPRSTIVVTVRLANPPTPPAPDIASGTNSNSHPPPGPPTTGPSILSRQKSRTFTALSLKKSRLMNLHSRDASQSSNNIIHNRTHPPQPPPPLTPPPPIPAKPAWNRPRVSSNLASCKPFTGDDIIDEDVVMENETEDVLYVSAGSPPALSGRFLSARTNSILKTRSTSGFRADSNNRPIKAKKGKASKTGSRLAMLRWAILNDSGPEVGMRIKAMGVRLAKDIWEAERCLDDDEEEEVMHLENGSMTMEGSVVSSADLEPDKIMQDAEEPTSLQTERERIAEECIRELEDMDVDQEVDQEMAPAEQDEQRVEDKCTSAAVLPNEDSMDIDAPTPTTANTVQQATITTPKATSPPTTQTPTTTPRIQRRMSFPKRLQVRVDQEVEVLSKTASNTDAGRFPRRRSLADDKIPMMVAAKKWFEKTAL